MRYCGHISALFVCLVVAGGCGKRAAPKPLPTEADLVGVWNGHPTYSQKSIDETHAKHPDGDYELLVRSTKRREQVLLHTIELKEDGTYVPPPRFGGPWIESTTWSLSDDGTEVLITSVMGGSRSQAERTHTIRTYRIADDGQALIALINDGEMPETYGHAYHKFGSEAYARAFPKVEAPQEQWGCDPSFKAANYFGTWVGHHTMSQEHWEAIRGTKSLEDTNNEKAEFEMDAKLVLNRDMTFSFWTPTASSKGKWHMEGSVAVLDWDDRKKPGYQSTRPSPTKMPVPLKLQGDGILIVELRKYGSTGLMVMERAPSGSSGQGL